MTRASNLSKYFSRILQAVRIAKKGARALGVRAFRFNEHSCLVFLAGILSSLYGWGTAELARRPAAGLGPLPEDFLACGLDPTLWESLSERSRV